MSILQDFVLLHVPIEKKEFTVRYEPESNDSSNFKPFLILLALLAALGVSIYYSIPEPSVRRSLQSEMLKRSVEPDLCLQERQHHFEIVRQGLVPAPFRPCMYY